MIPRKGCGFRIAGEAGSNPLRAVAFTAVLVLLLAVVRLRSLIVLDKAQNKKEGTGMKNKKNSYSLKLQYAMLESSWAVGASAVAGLVALPS